MVIGNLRGFRLVCNKFCNLGGKRVRKSVGSAGAWDTWTGKEWPASDWERMVSIVYLTWFLMSTSGRFFFH